MKRSLTVVLLVLGLFVAALASAGAQGNAGMNPSQDCISMDNFGISHGGVTIQVGRVRGVRYAGGAAR